jgi:hypothetical protein
VVKTKRSQSWHSCEIDLSPPFKKSLFFLSYRDDGHSGHCSVEYLAETITAIIDGHPQSQIEDLMPWRFRKTSAPSP